MDIWTIKETFIDRFYEKYGSPIQNKWVVVDIGAGIGDFSIFCAYGHPDNRIYSFEPTPESFLLLKNNLAVNNISNVIPYQQAVWSSSGEISLNTDHPEPGQFSSQPAERINNSQSLITASSKTIEEIFQTDSIDKIHLIKLDCEGAEYPILFNTPDYIYSRIERVVMEYHDSIGKFNHQDLVSFMENEGYIVSTYSNFVHADLGYLYAIRRDIV